MALWAILMQSKPVPLPYLYRQAQDWTEWNTVVLVAANIVMAHDEEKVGHCH